MSLTEPTAGDQPRPDAAVMYPRHSPWPIQRPPMRMTWEQVTLLHWRYPAEEVQNLLPDGLTIETFDGSAWIGLVPFQMRVDLPFLPELASILHFPETNVRTYVTDREGRPGVWFFSLEATSLPAVVTARGGYGTPYFWSDMTIEAEGDETLNGANSSGSPNDQRARGRIRYETVQRRWPKPKGATSLVEVEIGERFATSEISDIDHFLTGRWALFGEVGPLLTYGRMHHEPWPLHRVEVIEWRDELVEAAGLSAPSGDPLAHYAPIVSVRCGWPQRAKR